MVSQKALLFGFAITFLTFTACSDQVDDISPNEEIPTIGQEVQAYDGVHPEIWDYFNSFEVEGLARGIDVDLRAAGISGVIEEILEDGVVAQSSHSSENPKQIIIDATFWENTSDLAKEFVIFHELGHCYLARDHREGTHEDGTCLSIMRSGPDVCRDNYTPTKRSDYLDELFDERFHNEIN